MVDFSAINIPIPRLSKDSKWCGGLCKTCRHGKSYSSKNQEALHRIFLEEGRHKVQPKKNRKRTRKRKYSIYEEMVKIYKGKVLSNNADRNGFFIKYYDFVEDLIGRRKLVLQLYHDEFSLAIMKKRKRWEGRKRSVEGETWEIKKKITCPYVYVTDDGSELIVPRPAVGTVIGKGGDMIKEIQQNSGAHVQFIQSKEDISGDRLCQITGSMDQVAKASSLIRGLIKSVMDYELDPKEKEAEEIRQENKRDPEFDPTEKEAEEINQEYKRIIIPRPAVDVVIGKEGDMIKRIQQDSGADVQFLQGKEDKSGERLCQITGSMDQVAKASSLIMELINSVMETVIEDFMKSVDSEIPYTEIFNKLKYVDEEKDPITCVHHKYHVVLQIEKYIEDKCIEEKFPVFSYFLLLKPTLKTFLAFRKKYEVKYITQKSMRLPNKSYFSSMDEIESNLFYKMSSPLYLDTDEAFSFIHTYSHIYGNTFVSRIKTINIDQSLRLSDQNMKKIEKKLKNDFDDLKAKIYKTSETSFLNFGDECHLITIPTAAVCVVIGKGGDMIKRIQQDSGAHLQFIQSKENISGDRLCQITGSMDQVAKASSLIMELINSVMDYELDPKEKEAEEIRQENKRDLVEVFCFHLQNVPETEERRRKSVKDKVDKIFVLSKNSVFHAIVMKTVLKKDMNPVLTESFCLGNRDDLDRYIFEFAKVLSNQFSITLSVDYESKMDFKKEIQEPDIILCHETGLENFKSVWKYLYQVLSSKNRIECMLKSKFSEMDILDEIQNNSEMDSEEELKEPDINLYDRTNPEEVESALQYLGEVLCSKNKDDEEMSDINKILPEKYVTEEEVMPDVLTLLADVYYNKNITEEEKKLENMKLEDIYKPENISINSTAAIFEAISGDDEQNETASSGKNASSMDEELININLKWDPVLVLNAESVLQKDLTFDDKETQNYFESHLFEKKKSNISNDQELENETSIPFYPGLNSTFNFKDHDDLENMDLLVYPDLQT